MFYSNKVISQILQNIFIYLQKLQNNFTFAFCDVYILISIEGILKNSTVVQPVLLKTRKMHGNVNKKQTKTQKKKQRKTTKFYEFHYIYPIKEKFQLHKHKICKICNLNVIKY